MVKSARLWRDIARQYAILEREGEGNTSRRHHGLERNAGEAETPDVDDQAPEFYKHGFQHRHYVLILASCMMLCEWADRSVLSITMESIKEEFELSDADLGAIASASLWLTPFAVTVLGRIADHVPKSFMLGLGVLGWSVCTFMTGFAGSFATLLFSRLLAGLSNCAGYPVAVSLMAEFFTPKDMTTAMGYFNTGLGTGGLIGLVGGGTIATHMGWRWAFWMVAGPQLILAFLLMTTVRNNKQPAPKHSWGTDLCELFRMPSLRSIALGAFVHGIMTGNGRFLSAVAEREYNVSPQTVGLVMGILLGGVGMVSAWLGAHFLDRLVRKGRDPSILLRGGMYADMGHAIFTSLALLSPTFGLFTTFSVINVMVACLSQGIDVTIQMLGEGRRGTTQALIELSWAVGMGSGPVLGGFVSDALEKHANCDSGCALSKSLLIIIVSGHCCRGTLYFIASRYFSSDVARVKDGLKLIQEADAGAPAKSSPRERDVLEASDDGEPASLNPSPT
eukprot:CAMPEP_0206529020 /NCGR_PEP_ID=MMETSP0325_2-20121206/2342_1 /ASSEMBLY_ACC=CAM_ASM_000347 /TAXON_ID=2866 /ORGANISM="Crypthecodinium cohnii, Strain Seligo" /LENGTH=505 /DNA_ID=CAMNT_0054024835 /DNA_START=17 /DNA_END=1530 /DNA_ORIENTATION=+